jgi:Acyl-CoA dehydrogenase, N-terminal domain
VAPENPPSSWVLGRHIQPQELAAAGFFRIFVPEAYGGLDLEPMAGLEVYEELARADASVAWCVWNGNTHWTTVQLAPEVAGAIHADPDVGAGCGNGATAEPVRHRQTKGAATDMFDLQPPRHISTLR